MPTTLTPAAAYGQETSIYVTTGRTTPPRRLLSRRNMAVSQRFIDLLNMPMPALRKLAKDREADLPPGGASSKWDLAKAVARTGNRDELEADSDGFLYAGSTAMSWFRLVPEDDLERDDDNQIVAAEFYPLEAPPLDFNTVKEALVQHAEGDPFDEEDRPQEITSKP